MKEGVVAKRYATALAAATRTEAEIDSTLRELEELRAVVESNPELHFIVVNPAVHIVVKEGIFSDLMKGMKTSRFIRELVGMAIENNRIQHLKLIVDAYRDITDQMLNRVRVRVRSAFPLEAGEEESLRTLFGRITGKQAVLSVEIDKTLIGGIVAQIGWTVYDGSVTNELRNLRTKFKTWLEEDI
jgi:F-type H+-transporting ATPase subunit delta